MSGQEASWVSCPSCFGYFPSTRELNSHMAMFCSRSASPRAIQMLDQTSGQVGSGNGFGGSYDLEDSKLYQNSRGSYPEYNLRENSPPQSSRFPGNNFRGNNNINNGGNGNMNFNRGNGNGNYDYSNGQHDGYQGYGNDHGNAYPPVYPQSQVPPSQNHYQQQQQYQYMKQQQLQQQQQQPYQYHGKKKYAGFNNNNNNNMLTRTPSPPNMNNLKDYTPPNAVILYYGGAVQVDSLVGGCSWWLADSSKVMIASGSYSVVQTFPSLIRLEYEGLLNGLQAAFLRNIPYLIIKGDSQFLMASVMQKLPQSLQINCLHTIYYFVQDLHTAIMNLLPKFQTEFKLITTAENHFSHKLANNVIIDYHRKRDMKFLRSIQTVVVK